MEHLKGTVAPQFAIPEPQNREAPPKRYRPAIVTAIAAYEFCRGLLILLILVSTRVNPNGHIISRLDVKVLSYIVTRHNVATYVSVPFIMALAAISVSGIGWGLLLLKPWARRILTVTSGATVVLWLRRFLVDWGLGEMTLKTEHEQKSVYAVIAIDIIICACLIFYPDVEEAFRKE